ncbi:MAG: rhodanese-like domain-containing protein [Desulfamplus sp.]|nr:rhodanese-like domain-containing protein [Desulfamplus sp.]
MNNTNFNSNSHLLKKTFWQISVFVILASIFALTVNHFRSDSIPIIGEWSVDARFSDSSGESLVISLEEAKRLFENKTALFLDARRKEQYDEGHIQGALSLPQQEVDAYFMDIAPKLEESQLDNNDRGDGSSKSKVIITYCDGDTCELSHELALFLKEMGFNNVKVLVNGWSVWQEAGLPNEIGE